MVISKKITAMSLMPADDLWQGFCQRLARPDMAKLLTKEQPEQPIMVALSGGGDSMALTLLLKKWCDEHGKKLIAAHVNHGLRAVANREAKQLQKTMTASGIATMVTVLPPFKDKKNLHHHARRARYDALAKMAAQSGARVVMLAHQENDIAENLLMRLSRRAGIHGLAAMKDIVTRRAKNDHGEEVDIYFLRPLLAVSRQKLQRYLAQEKMSFFDDPSNSDDKFLRARTRKILTRLEKENIASAADMATTARHLRAASDFVIAMANEKKSTMVDDHGGMAVVRRYYRHQPDKPVEGMLLHHWTRAAMEQWQAQGQDFPPPQDQIIKIIEATQATQTVFDYPDYWVVSDDRKILIIKKSAAVTTTIKPKEKIIWNHIYNIENLGAVECHVAALGRGKNFLREEWGRNFIGCDADQWLNEKTSRYFYANQPMFFWQDKKDYCLPSLRLFRNPMQEAAVTLSPIFI